MRRLAGAVALAAALALAGCGEDSPQPDPRAATEAAESAAREAVTSMTTYDHRTLAQDFAWVEDAGTEKFQDYFAEASAPVRKLVGELEARARGSVLDAATDYVDDSHVTVLLFVDQTITNDRAEGRADLEQLRVKAEMVRRDGAWLVDEVEVLNRSTGSGPLD